MTCAEKTELCFNELCAPIAENPRDEDFEDLLAVFRRVYSMIVSHLRKEPDPQEHVVSWTKFIDVTDFTLEKLRDFGNSSSRASDCLLDYRKAAQERKEAVLEEVKAGESTPEFESLFQ
jgi:hypothetical protein